VLVDEQNANGETMQDSKLKPDLVYGFFDGVEVFSLLWSKAR
jgi:hypothetical protein